MFRVPVYMIELMAHLRRHTSRFREEHGREPTTEELAQSSNVSASEIRRLMSIATAGQDKSLPPGEDPWFTTDE